MSTSTLKRAAFHSLGCKVNEYETRSMTESLKNAGFLIVPFTDKADIYVINTCTVTAVSDKKSRQIVRRAKNLNPDAVVVACGCYVEKDADILKEYCDILIGNNKKSSLAEEIEKYYASKERSLIKEDLFRRNISYETMAFGGGEEKTRAFLKIQDGCNAYCSYCIIPYVRGRSRSRAVDEIINEAKALSESGKSEVVLCGINLSDFHDKNTGLSELVKRLGEIETVKRIRLGSLEPDVFTGEFINEISGEKKLCPHFHISLQSACDKTLLAMKRRYTVNDVCSAIDNIRLKYHNPAICADVIAGFPGEEDCDFNTTYENIKALNLYELHVFPYSEREGTKACSMEGKLSKEVKQARAGKLIGLSNTLKGAFVQSFIGKELEVLFEEPVEIKGETYMAGFSKEYIKCLTKDNVDSGDILTVEPIATMDTEQGTAMICKGL